MKSSEMAQIVLKAAQQLEKNSSITYPKDLGSWGLEEARLDELKRHLRKLKVELKVFDIAEDEFPTLHGKDYVELELKSSAADAKKAMEVLKRAKAFPIEEHHISNLKERKDLEEKMDKDSFNMGLSGLETKEMDPEPDLIDLTKEE